jgi:hypothetical protein
MRPDNSHMKSLEVHYCRKCRNRHFYMRLPDSSDGYDRWLELAEVPAPDDVPSDGRGVCGACYELAGASGPPTPNNKRPVKSFAVGSNKSAHGTIAAPYH